MLTCGFTVHRASVAAELSADTGGLGATTHSPAEASTGRSPAVSTTFPPPEPGRHGIAELLTLVGEVRRLAFGNLPPVEALGRIRDVIREYDGA